MDREKADHGHGEPDRRGAPRRGDARACGGRRFDLDGGGGFGSHRAFILPEYERQGDLERDQADDDDLEHLGAAGL